MSKYHQNKDLHKQWSFSREGYVLYIHFLPLADIIFEVKDKEHPYFRRDGIDLVHPVEIPLMTVRLVLTI